ncbi:peptidoglycan DD-metalloendopeptidase family protein [Herbaspirillum sp. RTI4]|uniref:murein hydrolase activator EnvC family protein n=1 Tax=Herbaspirillum sp. RTI4 TaxID=3048640 RepID=UPI002AB4969B|nr:peptidoglycan DD-metalloendopeptidase family protein [Herbaspirillum sp. RTI4]MDY7577375.1 peptidoglycan DD-metalloendopeptidase family protein [Herbaspirillum sp. RTI4]MEA9982397.1 peptidoglycan DD-metalloendopeptidase family protein [Herbaspirillum sp. RTI4]
MAWLPATLAVLFLAVGTLPFLLPTAQAQALNERTRQKQLAENERAALQEKLGKLKRDINQTETAKGNASDALSVSETAIAKANRALHDLSSEQQRIEAKLAQLSQQQTALSGVVNLQQAQLYKLLRQQYEAGNEDRIKLLLSGDNPNRINRDLRYMGYVSQAQAKLIDTLRSNLQAVKNNQEETQKAQTELSDISQKQLQQKAVLEQEKSKRVALLAQLSSKLSAQRKEAGSLQQNDQRLSGLVDKLAQLIEEQKKTEAAAREKRRQELLAKAKAARDRRAAASRKSAPAGSDKIDDDQPASQSAGRNDLVPSANEEHFGKPFAELRGQLRLPVRGELAARFGAKRGEGPVWKGLFIRAADGAEVRAVAAGRVVFADSLRGFGNLIIVDHGNQYMTIYGNNQGLSKHPGDLVKTGDVIATVGNAGGNEQSGLYFEMRHQGRAFDPLAWVTTR